MIRGLLGAVVIGVGLAGGAVVPTLIGAAVLAHAGFTAVRERSRAALPTPRPPTDRADESR
jgi:hypothetical protein